LQRQQHAVAIYNLNSFVRGTVSPATALRILKDEKYVGIGNNKRIRALRPLAENMSIAQLHQASRTTQRPRGMGGELIAPNWVVKRFPASTMLTSSRTKLGRDVGHTHAGCQLGWLDVGCRGPAAIQAPAMSHA
jgi:hypothetical protein